MITLDEWWRASSAQRAVVLDEVLEKMPPGFYEPRAVGHAEGTLPQFIHREMGVLFHLVFGGRLVSGMSDRRFQRLTHVRIYDDDLESAIVPVPMLEEAQSLRPSQEREIAPALVADQPLVYGALQKLGLPDDRIGIRGVSPLAVGHLLSKLTRLGWRAPSELEWEFVCRAVNDTTDDDAPPLDALGRLAGTGLDQMGLRVELCSDSWADALGALPGSTGHEVLRGEGSGARFVGWSGSPSWREALWPGRHRLATWRGQIAFRPWVTIQ